MTFQFSGGCDGFDLERVSVSVAGDVCLTADSVASHSSVWHLLVRVTKCCPLKCSVTSLELWSVKPHHLARLNSII